MIGNFDRLFQHTAVEIFWGKTRPTGTVMGRSAKIVRSTSYEKVKKMKKGQCWRYVISCRCFRSELIRESGSRQIRHEKKSARPSQVEPMIDIKDMKLGKPTPLH